MADETQTETVTAEETQATAEFEAGFTEPTSAPPAQTTPAPETVKAEEPKAETAAPTAEVTPAAPVEPKYVQITESQFAELQARATQIQQIQAAMDKQFGTAFGKMGGLERTLRELQSATPAGQDVTVSEDDFVELKAEFPDLAKWQVAGLNRVLAKLKVKGTAPAAPATPASTPDSTSAPLDPAAIEALVSQRVTTETQKLKEETARELLALKHENWEAIVGDKDSQTPYRQWLATQSADYQRVIHDTWDPKVVAKSIDMFKAAQAAATPKSKPPAANPRAKVLEAAVTVRGAGANPGTTTVDEFEEGFHQG